MASATDGDTAQHAIDVLGEKISPARQHSLYQRSQRSFEVAPSSCAEKVHGFEIGDKATVAVFRDGICLLPTDSQAGEQIKRLSLWHDNRQITQNGKGSTKINLTQTGAEVLGLEKGQHVVVSVRENGVWVQPIDLEAIL